MIPIGLNSEKGLRQTNNLIVKLETFRRSLLETFQRFLTALASHYEQMTKDAEAKVIEEQKLLEQYQAHGYLYGREAEDLKEHTEALIRSSQQIADTSAKMAKMQRELAKAMKQ